MNESSKPCGVHLVGSVPLASEEDVFRTMSEVLGDRLRRMPDGETGARFMWIGWQIELLAKVPQLEMVAAGPASVTPQPHFRLREGVDPRAVDFGNFGYADAALGSYAIFERLQQEGVIPAACRFQVSIPTPLAGASAWLPENFPELDEPFERVMLAELDRILAGIPHEKLAIQWDVCVEVWMWEGWIPVPFAPIREGIVERIVRLGDAVPDDIELGFHLCYGDYEHKHLQEPEDTTVAVTIANELSARIARPIHWVHLPVPIERDDDAYFAPLADLKLHPETELYLGLVHFRDGVEGAGRRIEAAKKVVPEFGVATECGMGRRPPDRGGSEDTLQPLLQMHAATSRTVR